MKKVIENTVKDLVETLLWEGRKEDEDLPRGEIEKTIESGEISVQEIIDIFAKELKSRLNTSGEAEMDEIQMIKDRLGQEHRSSCRTRMSSILCASCDCGEQQTYTRLLAFLDSLQPTTGEADGDDQ